MQFKGKSHLSSNGEFFCFTFTYYNIFFYRFLCHLYISHWVCFWNFLLNGRKDGIFRYRGCAIFGSKYVRISFPWLDIDFCVKLKDWAYRVTKIPIARTWSANFIDVFLAKFDRKFLESLKWRRVLDMDK